MKELYIENRRVVIDVDNFYIPFKYKVTDVENPEVINLPVSKSISVPRVQENDEIFGHIGELSRITIGNDFEVGVKFNQIKKCRYELFDNGELKSKGRVVVTSVDKKNYNITLSDNLLDMLEMLNSDDAKLNLVDLYHLPPSGQIFSLGNTAEVVQSLNTNNYGIVPTFNIDEDAEEKKKIFCIDVDEAKITTELSADCQQMNIKTFKAYETNYAVSMRCLIDSLNKKDYGFGTDWLVFDEGYKYINQNGEYVVNVDNNNYVVENEIVSKELTGILDDIHLFCKRPKTTLTNVSEYVTLVSTDLPNPNYYYVDDLLTNTLNNFEFKKSNGSLISNKSVKLNANLDLELKFAKGTFDDVIVHQYNAEYPAGMAWRTSNVGENQFIGSLWFELFLKVRSNDGSSYFSKSFKFKIDLRWNNTITYSGSNCVIRATIPTSFLYTGSLIESTSNPSIYIRAFGQNPNDSTEKTYLFFGLDKGANNTPRPALDNFKLYESQIEITDYTENITGGNIKSKNILSEVKVKDLLIKMVQFFNLDIEVTEDFRLRIFKRLYKTTDEVLILDKDNVEVNTQMITNDKFILSAGKPDATQIKTYESQYIKKWCEQLLYTGYSIKESKKDITFDVGVPFYVTDTNTYAYDMFMNTKNGGYSLNPYGYTKGLPDISFGYLKQVNEKLYVSDSQVDEYGYVLQVNSDIPDLNEVEIAKQYVNDYIIYDDTQTSEYKKFKYRGAKEMPIGYSFVGTTAELPKFYTFIPYKFNGNTVEKSLEMGKPSYNWAGLTDTTYPNSATHYNRIFKNKFVDMYSQNTHIIKTKIRIDGRIDVNKIYNIDGVYYVICNLPEYDLTKPGMYEVELLRVNQVSNYSQPFN